MKKLYLLLFLMCCVTIQSFCQEKGSEILSWITQMEYSSNRDVVKSNISRFGFDVLTETNEKILLKYGENFSLVIQFDKYNKMEELSFFSDNKNIDEIIKDISSLMDVEELTEVKRDYNNNYAVLHYVFNKFKTVNDFYLIQVVLPTDFAEKKTGFLRIKKNHIN